MASRTITAEELFEHSDWILRLARRLVGDPAAADDVAQQTMVAALRKAPAGGGLRPWLTRVTTNFARRRRRAERRRSAHERAASPPDVVIPSAGDLAEARDTLTALVDELGQLEEPFRTVVTLRYMREQSSADIARQLGIPAGTVRWRLSEGLARLRGRLDGRFGERGRWASCLATVLGRGGAGAPVAVGAGGMAWGMRSLLLLVAGLGSAAAAVVLIAGDAPFFRAEPPAAVPSARAASDASPQPIGTGSAEEQPLERQPLAASAAVPYTLEPDHAGVLVRVIRENGRALADVQASWPEGLDAFGFGDATGRVVLRFRPPTDGLRTRVLVESPGFATRVVEVRVSAGRWTDLGVISLPRAAVVTGRVVDENGTALQGAHVFVTDGAPPTPSASALVRGPDPWTAFEVPAAVTSDTGHFRLAGVPALPIRVWAGTAGRRFAFKEVQEPRVGEPLSGTELRCGPLPPAYAVEGSVVGPSGEPLAHARLRLHPMPDGGPSTPWPADHAWRRQPRWIEAGDDGRFRFAGRSGFVYDLVAEDALERWGDAELEGVPAGTRGLVLQLSGRR